MVSGGRSFMPEKLSQSGFDAAGARRARKYNAVNTIGHGRLVESQPLRSNISNRKSSSAKGNASVWIGLIKEKGSQDFKALIKLEVLLVPVHVAQLDKIRYDSV
jgi:hypothetical protein